MARITAWIRGHIHGFIKALLLFILIFAVSGCDLSKGVPPPGSIPPRPETLNGALEMPEFQDMPELKIAIFSYAVRADGTPESEQPLVGKHLVTYM
jgi:hypothetical protein